MSSEEKKIPPDGVEDPEKKSTVEAGKAPAAEPKQAVAPFPLWLFNPEMFARYGAAIQDKAISPFDADRCYQALSTIDIGEILPRPYETLESILRERNAGPLKAVYLNAKRSGLMAHAPDLLAAGSTAATFAYAGHPVIGLALGAVFAVARRVRDSLRVRAHGRHKLLTARSESTSDAEAAQLAEYAERLHNAWASSHVAMDALPPIEEFRNVWLCSCWRLVHIIRGYNARVSVVNLVVFDTASSPEDMEAARQMARLIIDFRPQIIRIQRKLEDGHLQYGSVKELAKLGSRLTFEDIFGDENEPSLNWLPLPDSILLKAEIRRQVAQDLAVVRGEVHEQEIDRKLAELERQETERTAKMTLDELDEEIEIEMPPDTPAKDT